jgi:hypothetical protein
MSSPIKREKTSRQTTWPRKGGWEETAEEIEEVALALYPVTIASSWNHDEDI